MKGIRPKCPRVRLDLDPYRSLRHEVLARDGWRCQRCGGLTNLEVHHLQSRSKLGHDAQQNLITLCVCCHRSIHRQQRHNSCCRDV